MRQLFVYGTLQRGERNHIVLAREQFMGIGSVYAECYELPFFNFPILRPHSKRSVSKVWGEIYNVDEETLIEIDSREKWYKRKLYPVILVNDRVVYMDVYEGFKYIPYFLAKDVSCNRWRGQ